MKKPRFKNGETVRHIIGIFTVNDSKWNGFTYMYSFKESEMRCGEMYLAPYGEQSEKEISKYDTLKKIVEQLEWCNYQNEAGSLNMNVAFISLKRMANLESN